MNTKAVKSFGLALMLAAGVLAVLLALGTFSPQKAAAQTVGTVSINPGSGDAGAGLSVRVNFAVSAAPILSGNDVTVVLPSFGVPASIDTSDVTVRTTPTGGETASSTPRSVVTDSKKNTITVKLDDDVEIGDASITFDVDAGISAPTASGSYTVTVNGEEAGAAFTVARTLKLSKTSGDKDTVITVSGTGFDDGTVSLYVTEAAVTDVANFPAKAVATAKAEGGAFSADIKVNENLNLDADGNVPGTRILNSFVPGNANVIHAVDPRDEDGFDRIENTDDTVFTLSGKLTITGGSTLVLGVKDVEIALSEGFPANGTVGAVRIGGTLVPFGTASTTAAERATAFADPYAGALSGSETLASVGGAITIKIDVPNTLEPDDEATLALLVGTADDADTLGSATVVVKAIDLTLNPTSAVQGNTVSVSGSGFGTGDLAKVATLTVGGKTVSGVADKPAIAGSYLFTFQVPDADPGEKVAVRLEQKDGKLGTGTIEIKKPTIAINPTEGRTGTTIVVTGTGFPANDQVILTYGGPADAETASIAHIVDRQLTDAAGNFNSSFNVPSGATPGSAGNLVQAFRPALGTNADRASNAEKHTVPGPVISIEPKKGQAGDTVIVKGLYHRSNAPVVITIGTSTVAVSPDSADAQGDFTFEVEIPGNQGQFPVLTVKVDNVIPAGGTAIIEVLPTPEAPATRDAATEFAGIGDALESVFRFDNATKTWDGYNPDAPAAANDLKVVNSGDKLWIAVSEDAEYNGEALTPTWNLVVAP